MNSLRMHKKKVEGILLVKTNPPSVKAGYGPEPPEQVLERTR